MRKTETGSSTVVGDEGDDGEQQPFSRHPHRFFEPIYPEGMSEDKPMFDEDETDVDEEEYWWAQQAINEFANREDEEKEVINEHENSSVSGTFDSFHKITCVLDRCRSIYKCPSEILMNFWRPLQWLIVVVRLSPVAMSFSDEMQRFWEFQLLSLRLWRNR
ncbi:hypothetical protein HanPSC8_Chr13g0544651 [Helianthus annuus]|nr:hypothetical protein HanPSC8_Chr13g0544651 [Helianthus annuus]